MALLARGTPLAAGFAPNVCGSKTKKTCQAKSNNGICILKQSSSRNSLGAVVRRISTQRFGPRAQELSSGPPRQHFRNA